MIALPRLEALLPYAGSPPSPEAVVATASTDGPIVYVRLVESMVPPPWLADPNQPLNADERTSTAGAPSALLLTCDDTGPPLRRLAGFADLLSRLVRLGGTAILLPRALRAVGRSRLVTLGSPRNPLARIFVHTHAVPTDAGVWLHTHGMEQLGLPDLEWEVAPARVAEATRLLGVVMNHLEAHERTPTVGEGMMLTHGSLAYRFEVTPARIRDDHCWGAYGARRLVLIGA